MTSERTRTGWTRALALLLLVGCSAEYHARKGRAALDEHQLTEAETQFRKAIDQDPRSPDALAGLGWTYQIAGKREAARNAFSRCVEVVPEQVECLRGLASVALSEGNPVQATELLTRARQLRPEDPGVQSSLALLQLSQGDLEGAATAYSGLVERFPEMAEYRAGYAEALLRQKKATEAIAVADAGLALAETPIRFKAALYSLKARALVAATGGRVDPRDCAATAPPVFAWLEAADAALKQGEETGVGLPDLAGVGKMIARRRAAVQERCPGVVAPSAGAALPALAPPPPNAAVDGKPPPLKRPPKDEVAQEGTGP